VVAGLLPRAGRDRRRKPAPRSRGRHLPARNKGNQLPNAEQAARLAGWLEAHTGVDAARPPVGDWRQRVLSIRRGTDGQDDAVARLIPALVVLPELPAWSRGHVLDACGVALSCR
jgi:hypothetical protein